MSTFTYIPATLFRANLQNPGFFNASLDLHIKGTLSPNKNFQHMIKITFLNSNQVVKNSFESFFSLKIADIAENPRPLWR